MAILEICINNVHIIFTSKLATERSTNDQVNFARDVVLLSFVNKEDKLHGTQGPVKCKRRRQRICQLSVILCTRSALCAAAYSDLVTTQINKACPVLVVSRSGVKSWRWHVMPKRPLRLYTLLVSVERSDKRASSGTRRRRRTSVSAWAPCARLHWTGSSTCM